MAKITNAIRNTSIRSNKGYVMTFNTKNVVDGIGNAANLAFKEIAPFMEADMKELAPVDTGRLRDSIQVKAIAGRNPRIETSTVFYGYFQEYGTHRFEAQPFIRPVLEQNARKWDRALASAMKKPLR